MISRVCVLVFVCLAIPRAAAPASEAMLLRLYLTDGTSIVSFGEFARVGEQVIFSMVLGGADEPRLHAATLPASAVDWTRTDRHAASTRHQWYARTRGEDDFRRLTDDVAAVLNTVVSTRDRARALEFADKARATLAEWPRQHYGYRQREVREILAILDEAISDLRVATGARSFNLSLVADSPDVPLEALAELPTPREQVDQAFHDARLGRRRPEVVQALHASVQGQIDAARHLRLLRDQWAIRRSLYIAYQRTVGSQLLQLVKAQPALEAIRRLDGPPPELLLTVQANLRGGAERLARVDPPTDLQTAHDLLVSAWRFAETAVTGRYQAARSADVPAAWEASSSAAGALMLLSRFQQELRVLLEPPQLQ